MELEKYVVVLESVLEPISDVHSLIQKQEAILDIEDRLKKCFIQYADSVKLEGYNSFTFEILDQINAFPQKESDFVVIANINDAPYFLMLKSTKDVIELSPGNALVIPNHVIFQFAVKEDCSFDHNFVGYASLFNAESSE